jgi:hypothetical protein
MQKLALLAKCQHNYSGRINISMRLNDFLWDLYGILLVFICVIFVKFQKD